MHPHIVNVMKGRVFLMGSFGFRTRVIASAAAAAVVLSLALVAPAAASRDDADRVMSDAARRAHSKDVMPAVPATPAVRLKTTPLATPERVPLMPVTRTKAVRWPRGSRAILDANQPTDTAGVAVRPAKAFVGRGAAGRLDLQVLDRTATRRAAVTGLLLSLKNDVSQPATTAVDVSVDYSAFGGAYGGDWSSRLHLVRLPNCSLTTPDLPGCQTQTPVASTNDIATSTVTAEIAPEAMGVMALVATSAGPSGNWAATPLTPSASWQVSAQTGDFTWAYPLQVPQATGGPEPELALSYDAGSLDGKVAGTNTQASWIGDGWDMSSGYVERSYVPCAQDGTAGANNTGYSTGDLCWGPDNATLVFNGKAEELVRDTATGTWHVDADDGTRIDHLTGGWNDDNDGEYWKVTTTDGTQYWFGREKRSSTDPLDMESAWTVPVFGNNPGEPCYTTTYASSSCVQAWRWNLDYVVDPSGNSLTYSYVKETNNYGRNLNQAVSTYVRGGYLTRIDYGQRTGSETANAPDRVDFTVAERCLPSGAITCDPAQLTSTTTSSWPDVPYDQICSSTTSCSSQVSPSFFSRKRLAGITTRVWTGAAYQDVTGWAFTQSFPDPGDGTSPALWLSSIQKTGLAGTAIALPPVQFTGTRMANRVDTLTDGSPAMYRYRVIAIHTETGAGLTVGYTEPQCTPTNLPASADSNTLRCFPVRWNSTGAGTIITEYFHKYLVSYTASNPNDATSQSVETHYDYVDGAAWRYDDDALVPAAQRTWNDFRGYATVDVTTGALGDTQSNARTRFFRGMDGNQLTAGGTASATVDGIADVDRLNGFVREQITYNGVGGSEVSGTINTPWISAARATGADGKTAMLLGTATTEQRITAPALADGERTTRIVTTFDPTYGNATQIEDQGDISDTTDDRCTRLTYALNPAANIVSTVSQAETVAVKCGTAPSRPTDVISDVRTFYDNGTYGTAPTRGLVTASQKLSTYTAGAPVYVTQSTNTYDAQGRVVTSADALSRTTTTVYTPATGGPLTRTTVTSPDPDDTGALTAAVTVTDLDRALGVATKVTDPNAKVTTATYDALGRVTAVWKPGRTQGTKTANITFAYNVTATGTNAVTTNTLTAAETYLTSVALYDGLLRPRQTQSTSASRTDTGRIVTDTVYDSRGLTAFTYGAWYTTGAPTTTLAVPAGSLPSTTEYVTDGAGRTTTQIYLVNNAERWRTTTVYGGDRVDVTPPSGAIPTTTITDARGRTTELRQYLGATTTGTYQSSTYHYDPAGHLDQTKDAAGNLWTYKFDLRGRQVSSTDPDKGASSSTYDAADQLTTTTDARSTTLWYGYDKLGRKTAERATSATGTLLATWSYDTLAKGQLTSSTRYAGTTSYTSAVTSYDDGYRPLGRSVSVPTAEGALAGTYTTNYTYTPDGQPATIKYPAAGGLNAETVTTLYDSANMPQWSTGGAGWGVYVADTEYSSYGEQLMRDMGSSYAFDVGYTYEEGTRRLIGTTTQREGITGYDQNTTYTYDPAGNLTSAIDQPTVTGTTTDAQCFSYDPLRRLTQAWTPSSGNCAAAPAVTSLGGPASYWSSYTYDPIGNRTTDTTHATAGNTTRTYTYPAAGSPRPHGITGVTQTGPAGTKTGAYGYDLAGDTKTRTPAGATAQTLAWDNEGHLSTVTQGGSTIGSYVYDTDGNRLVRHQGGTTTIYLPGGEELSSSSTGTLSALRYYTFAGQIVAVRNAPLGAGTTTLVTDPHGTAQIGIANTTKAITMRRTDPFGNTRGAAATIPGDHGFLGDPTDTTSLTQIGARYYDASIGRFISVDPVMDQGDPQQWAGFSYSNNNPTTFSDPTGLIHISSVGDWVRGPSNQANNVASTKTSTAPKSTVTPPVQSPTTHKPSFWDKAGGVVSSVGSWSYKNRYRIGTVVAVIVVATAVTACVLATVGICAGVLVVGGSAAETAGGAAVAGEVAVSASETAVAAGESGFAAEAGDAAATTAGRDLAESCLNSFAADTPVLMADGKQEPISDVKVGDKVIATDPQTGRTEARPVTALIRHSGKHTMVDLILEDGSKITTTDHHPFWDASTRTFTDAINLHVGDQVLSDHGRTLTITDESVYDRSLTAFNLQIDGIHTYYAGRTPVLVHNSCGPLTNPQATQMAGRLGYRPTNYFSKGERVFTDGKNYITQDIDSHSGGLWKMARKPDGFGNRIGTYDYDLNDIGP